VIDARVLAAYDDFRLDIDAHIPDATLTGLVGPNGSGKSTLLKSLAGVTDFEGEVRYNGQTFTSYSHRERVRLLSYVAQSAGTPPAISVRQLVEMGRSAGSGLFWKPSSADAQAVDFALHNAGLSDLADRPVTALSGGQVQRAMTARAFAQGAQHMLLDEPTNHLDLHHQHALLGMLKSITVDEGFSVGIALHDLALAAQYCDRLIVLHNGATVAEGNPLDVLTPSLLNEVFGIDAVLERRNGTPTLVVNGATAPAEVV